MLSLLDIHQPDVGVMDQGGRLQGLTWLLLCQFGGSQFAEFVVDKWQELIRGRGIALLDLRENLSDIFHADQHTAEVGEVPSAEVKKTPSRAPNFIPAKQKSADRYLTHEGVALAGCATL